ncbi:uncharacterized protein LACBIDRAFT_336240 [Laccaria bicolor S238N-H82]|uniref:Predicted protein n=1 Tax=Laccaria bicolor (strain S238N-H82 / ATCC MYA-4686) TaxID=486041 RepID=B0E4U4_LACBS|nr:uncharacterized protein LACBIDRAFT_336240 [Laccaria bicolor S238N-H82]EDQ98136.1 predicted protein [Laccaria bicolor S238N-H82]|eukprot:XP_001891213.1 predicted protein [Laccaria bicolor S238N-H82]
MSIALQTTSSDVFHCNALDWIAVRTQHTHPTSQAIMYHCKGIDEPSDDFEEGRVGHEVALPCQLSPFVNQFRYEAFVYNHPGVTLPFILGYTTGCFIFFHLIFFTGFSPTPAPAKGRGAQQGLPPPPKSAAGKRQTSVSPMPRKRYTVALGGPITAPPDEDEFSSNAASLFYTTAANTNVNLNTHTDSPATALLLKRVGTPRSYSRVIGGSFSVSPVGDDEDDKKEEEGAGEFGEGEETIGKSIGIKLKNANGSLSSTTSNSISPGGPGGGDYKSTATTSPSPSTRRIRAQSAYGYASLLPPQTPLQTPTMGTTAPLKPKLRSRSSERLSSGTSSIGTGDGMISGGLGGGGTKFVDPLLLRRHQQSQEGLQVKMPMPKPVGKVPIGQLVAFFDGEKGGHRPSNIITVLMLGTPVSSGFQPKTIIATVLTPAKPVEIDNKLLVLNHHHLVQMLECATCGSTFNSQRALGAHKSTCQKPKEKVNCPRGFRDLNAGPGVGHSKQMPVQCGIALRMQWLGKMVGCETQQYHLQCVALEIAPRNWACA